MAGSTLKRRRLRAELKRLREALGVDQAAAAKEVGISKSTLSRIENGQVFAKVTTVRSLFAAYGTDPVEIQKWVDIAKDARQRGWWRKYSDVLPDGFDPYLGFEEEAELLESWEPNHVPGLLQTEQYMERLFRAAHPDASDGDIKQLIAVRQGRQSRQRLPRTWYIIGAAVLLVPVGGGAVMRPQIAKLIEAACQPGIEIQILPFSAGEHALGGEFTMMRFEDPQDSPLVYLEHQLGSLYLEEPAEINRYTMLFEHLRANALAPRDTLAELETAMKNF